ncbi:hypothetical protein SAMN05192583_2096 [Sphingomonas gellani]|uniref:Uncharacterized protein n=1 Tax=Sphingomonas gellani TaxID=1166340 RepID=A0A1H8DXU6_9SPHN|nr:hypothetical protein [Sphingomonas gellani]SEN11995.1 hypothetical protein SAMN05192583_2096 [Sphingomonas gellani]
MAVTLRLGLPALILNALAASVALGAPTSTKTIADLDLARPFAARSPWRFTATQGPPVEGLSGEPQDGKINLYISNDKGRSCAAGLADSLVLRAGPDLFSEPHFLDKALLVHPGDTTTLLLVQIASQPAMNGDQRTATLLFGYDRAADRVSRVYAHVTGRNNNQEVRYVTRGSLRGAVISAEPTSDAPFAFWVTVDRFVRPGRYKQVLRYRSATTYGDGNRLAVIDSEMPNIVRQLGLWRQGQPLPLPDGGCARPHLERGALWC